MDEGIVDPVLVREAAAAAAAAIKDKEGDNVEGGGEPGAADTAESGTPTAAAAAGGNFRAITDATLAEHNAAAAAAAAGSPSPRPQSNRRGRASAGSASAGASAGVGTGASGEQQATSTAIVPRQRPSGRPPRAPITATGSPLAIDTGAHGSELVPAARTARTRSTGPPTSRPPSVVSSQSLADSEVLEDDGWTIATASTTRSELDRRHDRCVSTHAMDTAPSKADTLLLLLLPAGTYHRCGRRSWLLQSRTRGSECGATDSEHAKLSATHAPFACLDQRTRR